MAGGIFKDQPFVLNPKCIVFSSLILAFYLLMGGRSIMIMIILYTISYVLLAWYDHIYECKTPLWSGNSPLGTTSIFKPQKKDNEKSVNASDTELIYRRKVYAFHALLVAPFLFYIAYKGNATPTYVFGGLMTVAIGTELYHGFRFFNPRI